MKDRARHVAWMLGAVVAVFAAGDAVAAVAPPADRAAERAFGRPDSFIKDVHLPLENLPRAAAQTLRSELAALGADAGSGYYDVRGGHWGSLVLSTPLLPGPGLGNKLSWAGLGIAAP